MKNITPEWEIVHMERVVHPNVKDKNLTAVYLLHKGHAISINEIAILRLLTERIPSYRGYFCIHFETEIPEEIMVRWIKMRTFLLPST